MYVATPAPADAALPGKRTLTGRVGGTSVQRRAAPPAAAGVYATEGGRAAREVEVRTWMDAAVRPDLYPAVQLRGDERTLDAGAVHAAAAHGVAGSGGALPYLDDIQRSFGRHEVGHVRAHVGGAAADASRAIGAEAYAVGDQVAFRRSPDLHTAAHEAAHVVQQRAGVHLKGGVGAAGDAYEQHADRVADLVVRGASAEHVLDEMTGGGGTRAVQRTEEADLARAADAGESRMHEALQATPGRVASTSVVRDVGDAQRLRDQLVGWDANLEEGRAAGRVPGEAIVDNQRVKDALSDYLASLGEQTRTLSDFQLQYQRCRTDFARVQGMIAQFQAAHGSIAVGGNEQATGAAMGRNMLTTVSAGDSTGEMGERMRQLAATNPSAGAAHREVARLHGVMQDAAAALASRQLNATAQHNSVIHALSEIEAGVVPRAEGAPEERAQLAAVREKCEEVKGYVRQVTDKLAEATQAAAASAGLPAPAASWIGQAVPRLGDQLVQSFYDGQISQLQTRIDVVEAHRSGSNLRSQVAALRTAQTHWLESINSLNATLTTFNQAKNDLRVQTGILAAAVGPSGNPDLALASRFLGELDPFVAQLDATIGLGEAEVNAAGHAEADRRRMVGGRDQAAMTYHEPYRSYHISDGWHYHAMPRTVMLYGESESTAGHARGVTGANPVTERALAELRQYKEVAVGFRREVGQALGLGDLGAGRAPGPTAPPTVQR